MSRGFSLLRSDSLFPDHPGELWFPAVTAEEEHEDEDGDDDGHDHDARRAQAPPLLHLRLLRWPSLPFLLR